MKKLTRLVVCVMVFILMLAVAGCGKKKDENKDEKTEEKAEEDTEVKSDVTVRVGSLKGPTSIGLVDMMAKSDEGTTSGKYTFKIAAQADEITGALVSGDIDIALIPANAASILYNKTEGKVTVIDINTLGVLYCVTGDGSITSVEDLAGHSVISMGQGTTPEYVLRYLLETAGVKDCEVIFVSEATEAAALLSEDPNMIAILPQPFVTAATKKNDKLSVAFSLTEEWNRLSGVNSFVTGVTVVRTDFLKEHEDAVKLFMDEHKASAAAATENLDATAEKVAELGIVEKAEIVKLAIPNCNITYVDGADMKTAISDYLTVLYNMAPESVGGKLPGDDFYYSK
ncbi:MAG: ABC transporter substrate-binding protein [Eubacterium sp.]|nr:ABC transporter substrate-binding protein [Eubacterium sp.]